MKRFTCFVLMFFAATFAVVAQQQPFCTASIPATDALGVKGFMLSDLAHGMIYAVYGQSIVPVSATDCTVGATIQLPYIASTFGSVGACIDSSSRLIGTAASSPSGGGTFIQVVDLAAGNVSHLLPTSGQITSGGGCAFANGLLYVISGVSNNYGGSSAKVIAIDPGAMTVMKTYLFGVGTGVAFASSSSGRVFAVTQAEYDIACEYASNCASELDSLNPDGSVTKLSSWTAAYILTPMFIGPNGYLYIAGGKVYDQNGQPISATLNLGGSSPAWPSLDPWYAYVVANTPSQGLVDGNDVLENILAVKLGAIANQAYLSVVASRQLGGTDLVVALRSGALDFFKVMPPMLVHYIANAGLFESPSFVPSSPTSVAPGSLITIYGQRLGSVGEYDIADTTKIVTQLGNTQVLLDGKTIQLLFVGYNQVNASLPRNLSDGTHTLSVKNGTTSFGQGITIVDQQIASFMWTSDPTNLSDAAPILTNTSYQLIGNPALAAGYAQASPNDVLTIWATGGGRTSPPLDDSIAVTPTSSLYYLAAPPQVIMVDKQFAVVTYAGLAPGETPGLNQVNFVVPGGLTSGAHDLTLGTVAYKGALWIK